MAEYVTRAEFDDLVDNAAGLMRQSTEFARLVRELHGQVKALEAATVTLVGIAVASGQGAALDETIEAIEKLTDPLHSLDQSATPLLLGARRVAALLREEADRHRPAK